MKININFGQPYFNEKAIIVTQVSLELAEYYIDRALEWDNTSEYREWEKWRM